MKGSLKVAWWLALLWACADPSRLQLRTPVLPPPPQVVAQECQGLQVQLTVERRPQGAKVVDVFITNAADHTLANMSRVVLAFTRHTQANTTTTLVARRTEAGHYTIMSEFLLLPDPWTVEVIMRRADGVPAHCLFTFTV